MSLDLAVAALHIQISGFGGINGGADEPTAGAIGEGEPRAARAEAGRSTTLSAAEAGR